jgi:hypothetical protein
VKLRSFFAAAAIAAPLVAARAAPHEIVANAAQTGGVAPSITADLDGDGSSETVTAVPARGTVRLEIRDASGRRLADAKAPAPAGDVVPVTLTSGPLGSAGALVEVAAATDASECRTIWRFRDGKLTPLPIRDASGRALPECAAPAGWSASWAREGEGKPAAWVRERTQKSDAGTLRIRETYGFAGFSLDFDASRSSVDVGGIPIPSWYAATFYSRPALDTLYSRFRLGDMRGEPTLRIETDQVRGIFSLRFTGPAGTLVAPVDAYSLVSRTATLGVRAGDRAGQAAVRLGGDGSVPYGIDVTGLGPEWDRTYAPAGSWRGDARQVFPSAADELAANDLAGQWGDASGGKTPIVIEGNLPYRLRVGTALYALDLEGATPPFDALLLPLEANGGGRPWGLVLKGQNGLERVPLACSGTPPRPPCRADGSAEVLKRLGGRVNVR